MTSPGDPQSLGNQVLRPERATDETYAPLWRAVSDLSLTWRQLPVVRQFATVLPRNAQQRSSGIPGRLQELQAGGGNISEFPLRLTRTVQLMSRMPSPFPQATPTTQEWNTWLGTARRVEIAHRITVAWLRSRLPGYPNLPAPQLARGAPLTAEEADYELVWTRDERAQGFQFQNPPSQISHILEAAPAAQHRLVGGTQSVATALEQSGEWSRLNAATSALTEFARTQLGQAREAVAAQLSKAKIDAHSDNLLARFNHRVAVLKEVLSTLSGVAEEYASAFDAANGLITTAASDVFGELTIYGPPVSISGIHNIDLRPGTLQLVSFTREMDSTAGFRLLEMGEIIWLDDVLVPDATRLIGTTVSMNLLAGTERWTGVILPGTRNAWPT
jgi:hypothetical protein